MKTYDKLLLVECWDGLAGPYLLVHEWLSEGRFVKFVVAPSYHIIHPSE